MGLKKEDLVRFKDPGGALLIVDRAIAAEFGYKESQDEVPIHIFEAIRQRQKEVNEQRTAKKVRRKDWPRTRASRSVRVAPAVASLQRPDSDPEVRGDVDSQLTTRTEIGRDDLEGGQLIFPLPTNEGGGEARDPYISGIIGPWSLGRDCDSEGEWRGSIIPLAPTIAVAQCIPSIGEQEGIDDSQINHNPN